MASPELKSYRFRAEREWDWRRLDALLGKVEKGGAAALNDDELLALPVLYRAALSSLSVARATSLDQGLVEYLESLSARAYFVVYGARATLLERVGGFLARDWPAAVRSLWRETLVSAAIFLAAVLAGYLLVAHDSDWFYTFTPQEMAGGRDPSASTAFLKSTLHGPEKDGLSVFAAFLFTHNAQIAILAFALGFALCLPTVMLVAYNGLTLGAFVALFVSRGLGYELGGWLLIHGTTELFAVVLAGAAGLKIGWSLAFPGARSRLDAAADAGRKAACVMGGVVVMLLVAGLLEGFGRQLIDDAPVRYAVAVTVAAGWALYYYLPRGRRADGR